MILFSKNGKRLVTGGSDGCVRIYSFPLGIYKRSNIYVSAIVICICFCFSVDNKNVNKPLRELKLKEDEIQAAAIAPNAQTVRHNRKQTKTTFNLIDFRLL